ncbi:MAG: hypothetical protein Q4F13_14035 [Pseudomonadota bacterium]|nr:hypothetical protein [Pseudomonadota bacterium]
MRPDHAFIPTIGSPLITPGQTLNAPSLQGLSTEQLARLGHTGGQIIGRNSQGLNARAQWLAEQQARAAAQQAARQGQGMSPDEAYARYMAGGGRSGSYQRALGEDYRTTWHQGQEPQAPQASWGQHLNAATERWASGIIDRLDEAAVADAGGAMTAAAAAVRAPARSALGVVQGAVNTIALADPAVQAELSEGLSRLMEDPQALLRAARNYYDEHSAGEIAADVYANGAAALMGGRLGAGTHRMLNRVPGLGTDVGANAQALRQWLSKLPESFGSQFNPSISGGRGPDGRLYANTTNTVLGAASGRTFDPSQAGGPVRQLHTNGVRITDRGVDVVERHISRFDYDGANDFMISRLRQISRGELEPTQWDLNYYTHELREYVRYRRLGWEVGAPDDIMDRHTLWNNAHTATLEDYGLNDRALYHPEALNVE